MTIYAVTNEQDSFFRYVLSDTSAFDTLSTQRDTNARCVGRGQGRMPQLMRWDTALDEVYLSMYTTWIAPGTANSVWIALREASSGTRCFDIVNSGTDALSIRYNNSGTMTSLHTLSFGNALRNSSVPARYTFYFKRGSSGVFRLYFKGVLLVEVTGNYTTSVQMNELLIAGPNPSESQRTGGFIVSDSMIVDHTLNTLIPTGAGNSSAWNGDWNQLSANGDRGTGSANVLNPVQTNGVNNKLLSTFTTMPSIIGNHSIRAVSVAAMGLIDSGASVSTVSLLARQSSTDYTLNSLNLTAGAGYSGYQQVLETPPAGGSWDATTLNAMQFGVIAT